MNYNGIDFDTYFKNYPDKDGFFGKYGGAYVSDDLKQAMEETTKAYFNICKSRKFISELRRIRKEFQGRPTPISHLDRLSRELGYVQLYVKREDLKHTGAHKLNHCMGEALLAKFMGKTKVIAETGAGQHGVALATAIMTILILIFGEIAPKIIAKAKAETVVLLVARPLHWMLMIFRPISVVVEAIEQHWEKKLNITNVTATEDELLEIVSTIEQEGVLEQEERELIESVIEFDDQRVRNIMIPKERVVFIYDNTSVQDLKKILLENKLSRLPVVSYQTLEVIGILRIRDVFDAMLEDKEIVVKDFIQEPIYVTQRKKLPDVLAIIQKSREHMAIVEDAIGSRRFVGIVTLEDVLEELVGEIYDEYDPLPNHVLEIGLHTFEIDGSVSLIDFFDQYAEDQQLPKTKQRTFANWIFELNNNRKVRKGREIIVDNFEMKVLETKDGMAARLELQIKTSTDEDLLL